MTDLRELEKILNNAHEPTIETLDKALHWLETFKMQLTNLALDEPPYKDCFTGIQMLGIHLFLDKFVLGEELKT